MDGKECALGASKREAHRAEGFGARPPRRNEAERPHNYQRTDPQHGAGEVRHLNYSVLLPCVFTVYLNPKDHATLSSIFNLVIGRLRAELCATGWPPSNTPPKLLGLTRKGKVAKEHKIACQDWYIEFLPDAEVPVGDIEIHSELNETTVEPGYRGTKTTLIGREPTATAAPRADHATTQRVASTRLRVDAIYADVKYSRRL